MRDETRRQAIARDLARQHQLCGIDELRVIDLVTGRLLAHLQQHGPLDLADLGGLVDRLGAGITRGDILDSAVSLIARELAADDAEREHARAAARVEMLGERPRVAEVHQAADYACTSCGQTMLTCTDFEEYQHDGCGGLVRLRVVDPDTAAAAERARVNQRPADVQIGMPGDNVSLRPIAIEASEWAPDQLTRATADSEVITLCDERVRDPELEVDVELDSGPHVHVYHGTSEGDECDLCGELRDQDLGDEWDVSDVGVGA